MADTINKEEVDGSVDSLLDELEALDVVEDNELREGMSFHMFRFT